MIASVHGGPLDGAVLYVQFPNVLGEWKIRYCVRKFRFGNYANEAYELAEEGMYYLYHFNGEKFTWPVVARKQC